MRKPGDRDASRLIEVRLHTRRDGDLLWHDRGRAFIPESAIDDRHHSLRYDAIAYRVEDTYDDGLSITVWAKAAPHHRGRPGQR